MAPNRKKLQNLSHKSNKSFREYAQWWGESITQVQLPLLEKEPVNVFMDTLQGSYYENIIGGATSNFSNLVMMGEHIENALKSGKNQDASSSQIGEKESLNNFHKRKEGETNAVTKSVEYYHGAPTEPYDPPSFQLLPFPTQYYPYVAATTPTLYGPTTIDHSSFK